MLLRGIKRRGSLLHRWTYQDRRNEHRRSRSLALSGVSAYQNLSQEIPAALWDSLWQWCSTACSISSTAKPNDNLPFRQLWTTYVKPWFFAQRMPCGKNHGMRKSGKFVKGCRNGLCKSRMHIHSPVKLWKTLVEKLVENVENWQLSTAISMLSPWRRNCGKVCIPVCIKQVTNRLQTCYVTGRKWCGFSEREGKSWTLGKNRRQYPPRTGSRKKIFVKNRQKIHGYQILSAGNTFPIPFITEETACREK